MHPAFQPVFDQGKSLERGKAANVCASVFAPIAAPVPAENTRHLAHRAGGRAARHPDWWRRPRVQRQVAALCANKGELPRTVSSTGRDSSRSVGHRRQNHSAKDKAAPLCAMLSVPCNTTRRRTRCNGQAPSAPCAANPWVADWCCPACRWPEPRKRNHRKNPAASGMPHGQPRPQQALAGGGKLGRQHRPGRAHAADGAAGVEKWQYA